MRPFAHVTQCPAGKAGEGAGAYKYFLRVRTRSAEGATHLILAT